MSSSTEVSRPDRNAPPRMESYEEARQNFRVDVPERFNPVVDIVERWANDEPDAEALLSIDGQGEVMRHTPRRSWRARRDAPRGRCRAWACARVTPSSSCCRECPPGTSRCWAPCAS